MEPKDLLKDLEKIDRTEEHLWGKKKVEPLPPPDQSLLQAWRLIGSLQPRHGSLWVTSNAAFADLGNAVGIGNQNIGGNTP